MKTSVERCLRRRCTRFLYHGSDQLPMDAGSIDCSVGPVRPQPAVAGRAPCCPLIAPPRFAGNAAVAPAAWRTPDCYYSSRSAPALLRSRNTCIDHRLPVKVSCTAVLLGPDAGHR